jgi:hypothetical protein
MNRGEKRELGVAADGVRRTPAGRQIKPEVLKVGGARKRTAPERYCFAPVFR